MILDWQVSITYADAADWITVAAYVLAAILCTRAVGYGRLRQKPREGMFWKLSAMLLLFLGINELLDLQTLLTMLGRAHAKAHGWYPEHRRIQYIFVAALAVGAVILGVAALWWARRTHYAVRLAVAGLMFIGLFILLRAASFHHLDDILGRGATEFPLGSVQEIAGILIIAVAALLYAKRHRSVTRGRPSLDG